MRLSVVTPNYNHARFLPEMVTSVLGQSYRDFEYLIVDDRSTDDSMSVIERLAAGDARIRVFQNEKNVGVVATLNRGLSLATGDYICFPAADDRVLPGMFEKSMALLDAHPTAGLCSGLSRKMTEDGKLLGVIPSPLVSLRPSCLSPERVAEVLAAGDTWIWGNATVFRRDALVAEGGFAAELRSYSDGFLELVLAAKHGACFVPEPLSAWRQMTSGYSSSMSTETATEIHREVRRLLDGPYAGLFPRQHVKRLDDYWRYRIHVTRLRLKRRPHERIGSILARLYYFAKYRSVAEWLGVRLAMWRLRT